MVTLDIDPSSGCDIIADLCEPESLKGIDQFDILIAAEVIEHVSDPFRAIEAFKVLLRSGGLLLASSPFDFRIHGPLPDNWRFTEHGWRQLLRDFSGVVIEPVGSSRFLMPVHYRVKAAAP